MECGVWPCNVDWIVGRCSLKQYLYSSKKQRSSRERSVFRGYHKLGIPAISTLLAGYDKLTLVENRVYVHTKSYPGRSSRS